MFPLRGRLDYLRHSFIAVNTTRTNTTRNSILLFLSLVILYLAMQLAMAPTWMLGGGVWAEAGWLYYPASQSPSWYTKLFSTDAGYIPLPQHLIALAIAMADTPAAAVPYLYTWTAALATSLMLACFCLSRFRTVIKSDGLRVVVVSMVMIVADWETRTFINFTYFSAFFIAIITALALVDDSADVPWWSWFIPALFLSKPAIMAVLPAVLITGIFSRSRFRNIALASAAVCIVQTIQLAMSRNAGVLAQHSALSTTSKLGAAILYFFGSFLHYTQGPHIHLNNTVLVASGLVFVCLIVAFFLTSRTASLALSLIGLSLIICNMVLNTTAVSDAWNLDLTFFRFSVTYRYTELNFIGFVFAIAGVLSALCEWLSLYIGDIAYKAVTIVLAGWFVASGWLSVGMRAQRTPQVPLVGNSYWEDLAGDIDQNKTPLCVPLDPWMFVYGRDCTALNFISVADLSPKPLNPVEGKVKVSLAMPAVKSGRTMTAFALMLWPTYLNVPVVATADVVLKDGSVVRFSGARTFNQFGGMLLVQGQQFPKTDDVDHINLAIDEPVDIAHLKDNPSVPAVLVMGR